MWINRSVYEKTLSLFRALLAEKDRELAAERTARGYAMQRMAELKTEHARELEDFRRRLAIAQANFEWLTVSHNQAQAERQAMFNSRAGVAMPPIQVGFDRAPAYVDEPSGVPPSSGGPERERPQRIPDDLLSAPAGLSFEDMGDGAAAREGISARVYDDPASLLT